MSIKAVLFDLDGTLLPMDQDTFIKAYLGSMAKKLAPHGYEPETLVKAVYMGMKAMTSNDGSCTNEEAFWAAFTGLLGERVREDMPIFDDFYRNEFQEVKNICGFLPEAAQTVRTLKEMGYRVILATTPMFPSIATESRIRWAGMEPEDFEIFTTYENYHFCKPSLNYYREILEQIGVKPEECLMVGNDVGEDMITEELGMKVFLMPADLINKVEKDISVYPQGNFEDLLKYIETL
ncbi:MAG: HAD family hydrolase [Agathobacter sp.]|nr:HAD family hydrolase [Agathobacter sp.]